jgi:thiol peroxidase
MSLARNGIFTFNNQDVTVIGQDLKSGDRAPEFEAGTKDWTSLKVLESTRGKVRIIGSLPSLSTGVCDRETRRFNESAAALSSDIVIIVVSMDLPWTLRNWCAAAGVDKVLTLTDHQHMEFGEKYGVLLKEPRVFRRAIFVVDREDKVVYAAYRPVLGEEPDYAEVLEAAQGVLG